MRIKLSTIMNLANLPGDRYRVWWDAGLGGAMVVLVERVDVFPGQQPSADQEDLQIEGVGTEDGGPVLLWNHDNSVEDSGCEDAPMGSVKLLDLEIKKGGTYQFEIEAVDHLGNSQETRKTVTVNVDEEPEPVTGIRVSSYDEETETIAFSFSGSGSF